MVKFNNSVKYTLGFYGAHYFPFVWAYQMPTFAILGGLIVISGSLIAYYFPNNFDLASYTTGGLIILFGIIHLIIVKKEIKLQQIGVFN